MASRRIAAEWSARLMLFGLVVGLPLWVLFIRGKGSRQVIDVKAAMPEAGGWTPRDLQVAVGEPLHLRLTSTDVVHGFAIGKSDLQPVDLYPGEVHELTLTFDQPGTYTYYCTRWCGVNHWRMRGTIDVTGSGEIVHNNSIPLYLELGIDLDHPREIDIALDQPPSAARGAVLDLKLPEEYLSWIVYVRNSPNDVWNALWEDPVTKDLNSDEIWDLVAWIWQENTTLEGLNIGQQLYTQNCSACHGENGQGDGVMAPSLLENTSEANVSGIVDYGHETVPPTDFTDPQTMLGASPALLQGKIIRGGMGTGMPYWGSIFTEDQIWDLVAYLWTFQFSNTSLTNP